MSIRGITSNLTFAQKVKFASEQQQKQNETSSVTNNICTKYAMPEINDKPQASISDLLKKLVPSIYAKYAIPEMQNNGTSNTALLMKYAIPNVDSNNKPNNDIADNDAVFMKYAIPRA